MSTFKKAVVVCSTGVALLFGAGLASAATPAKKIYQVLVTLQNPCATKILTRSLFSTPFGARVDFETIQSFSPQKSAQMAGWAQVEKDGAHYRITLKNLSGASQVFSGTIPGNRDIYKINLTPKMF